MKLPLLRCLGCLALLLSCATVRTPGAVTDKPGLRQAVSHVWSFYGRRDQAPNIRIVEGADLSCNDPNSGDEGFPVILGAEDGAPRSDCREGFTFLPTEVMVAYTGKKPWSRTSLAHELEHAKQARDGIIDPGHRRFEWLAGGEVDQANAQLEAMGL